MLNKEQHFNKIIAENGERINRICAFYQHNAEEQKDLFQEVLMNIWKSLDNFRGKSALSTWIYRIAVNTSLTYRRNTLKEQKWQVELNEDQISVLMRESGESDGKEHQIKNMELALHSLSIIDKSLITLMLEGLSMKEIADVIGLTEPNVKVKIHRIKKDLKNQLKKINHE